MPGEKLPYKKLRGYFGASFSLPWPRLDVDPYWCGQRSFSKTSSVEVVGPLDS